MKIASVLLTVFCSLALSLAAVASPTPEEVALRHLSATKESNWGDYTDSLHPAALARFKEMMIPTAEAAQAADSAAGKSIVERVFANADIAKLKAAPPADFFKTFITNWSAKNRGFTQAMKNASIQMLGHVNEGDKLAYAVYRITIPAGNTKVTKVEVISLEKDGDAWKCQLSSELENLSSSLMRQLKTK
jgi:hypothetical protein